MNRISLYPLLALVLIIASWSGVLGHAQSGLGQEQETPTPELTSTTGPASDTPTATATTAPTLPNPTATPTGTEVPAPTIPGYPGPPTTIPTITSPPNFYVSGVEPKTVSQETGGLISIYGEGFGSGTAVRLAGYGLLDTSVLNSTAIRAVIPPGLSEKTYDLEVFLDDGRSYVVEDAVKIKGAKATQTPTATPAGVSAYRQPQLLIETARSEPEILVPGLPFTLHLEITNRGDYTAANVRLSLAPNSIAVPVVGSSQVILEDLLAGASAAADLSLALSESAAAGYNSLEILVEYSDYYGRSFSSGQNVGLDVRSSLSNQPIVLLASYSTEPETITPGDPFTLHLELSNVGGVAADQLLLTLGAKEGSSETPFALIGSGNVKFVPSLAAGKTTQVEQGFILDGSADPGVYNLPVTLEYRSPEGVAISETQTINLLASRRPQLRVDFYRTLPPALPGEPVELPVEIVNIGRSLVNVSTVELSGPGLEIQDGVVFIGALDAGTSGSLDAVAIPQESGSLPVLVEIHYLDDFNHPRVYTHTLPLDVQAPTPTPEGPESAVQEQGSGFWDRALRVLRGLFGLGS